MKVLHSAICDDAGQTPDGKIDLRGVFHDLYAPGFPAQQGRMTLVVVIEWDREDHGRYQFRVDMVAPGGEVALTVEGHSDVADRDGSRPPPRSRLVMPLEQVVFPEAGEYRFDVKLKGQSFVGPTLYLIQTADSASVPVDG